MLDIGFSELVLLSVIALIVLGPDKLPVAIRTLARWYARLRYTVTAFQHDIVKEFELTELRAQMQAELEQIKLTEQHLQAKLDHLAQSMGHFEQNAILKPRGNKPHHYVNYVAINLNQQVPYQTQWVIAQHQRQTRTP